MRIGRGMRFVAGVLAFTAVGFPAARSVAQTVTDPSLQVTALLPDFSLDTPTTMAFVGPDDILVLEKETGRVRRVLGGVLQPSPVLDVAVELRQRTRPARHRGQHRDRRRASSSITPRSPIPTATASRTAARRSATGCTATTGTAGSARCRTAQLILDLPVTTGPNHDGGVLLLGPPPPPGPGQSATAARCYVIIGDLNRNGQLQNNAGGAAPDDTSVILRVEQDGYGGSGQSLRALLQRHHMRRPARPAAGVLAARPASPRWRATSPTGCATASAWRSIRPAATSGTPRTARADYDEVNRVTPGVNSGWNPIMGPDSRDRRDSANLFNMPGAGSTYSDPEFSWLATIAPTAIVFPVGTSSGAAYDDVALVGDSNLGQLYRFPLNPGRDGFDVGAITGLRRSGRRRRR